MKKIFFSIIFMSPLLLAAQQDSVISAVYDWKQPHSKSQKIRSAVLFEGSTLDMALLQMNAASLTFSKTPIAMNVPADEEQLCIVKKGTLTLTINDSVNALVPGSIALLMPGQHFAVQDKNTEPCEYYVMKYRSRDPVDLQRGIASGGSFVKDWNRIIFKPNDKGGTRYFIQQPTAMDKKMDIHVTTLNRGLKSHAPHTHRAAEMIVMMAGETEMQVGQLFFKGKVGSVYYLGSNVLHGIRNTGSVPCTYFAIQVE